MVRDPRDIFASVQKQHLKNPMLHEGPAGEPLISKFNRLFYAGDPQNPAGLIGGPLLQIENCIRARYPNVVFVQFEKFVENPEKELKKLYLELGLDWWDGHDFDNVESAATDLDALYLNKYPHDGSGKVESPEGSWGDYISPDLASAALNRYPVYSQYFGYR
jgi:hypothetical protein